MLEKRAWEEGKGSIPVQRFADFCTGQKSTGFGKITPGMKGAFTFGNVRNIFPDELAASLESGIRGMDRKIHGFADDDALLSGVESRTSSPVRIVRGDDLTASVPVDLSVRRGRGICRRDHVSGNGRIKSGRGSDKEICGK